MDRLAEQFVQFVDTPWTPILLAVHAFLESSFLPGAHDFFIVAVTVAKPQAWLLFATFSTIGSTCGGCFGYALGKYLGHPVIAKIIHKKTVDAIEKSYQKFGMWAVAFAGFTPVPYKVFAACSGVFEINFPQFALVSLLSRGARFFMVSGLVYFIGPQVKDYIIASFNTFSIISLSAIALLYILIKVLKKRKQHV